jgi:predicted PurR-regulated permease PerM
VIFSIYFMLDGNRISKYWLRVVRIIIGHRSAEPFRIFLSDADRVFSGYIRGQFIDAAIIGVMTTIIMVLIGVPNGTVVGVLTGCGNLIPYVGPVVGYLTLALVCIPSGAWVKLLLGAVVLAVLLFVDGNIINPKLLSTNVMVHPLLVVAALIGGGAVGGLVGMLVAVPTAALIKVQFDRLLDHEEAAGLQHDKDASGMDDIPE